MKQAYQLDPDYRKNPPKEGKFCIRCQRPIRGKAVSVSYVSEWEVTEGGEHLIGLDCWKKISKGER